MKDYSDHIGIIGGGIAGLTLGCALLKEGIPATIFEKMPEDTSHGAAISLSPNALRLLDRLGIYYDLKNQSFIHSAALIQGTQKQIRDTFFALNQSPKYSGYSAWRGIGKSDVQRIHFALGPGSHIVGYPVNKKGDVSFVAVKKEDFQFKESWREEGSVKDLLDDFSIYDSKIFPALEDSMPLYKWGIYIRPPLKSMIAKNITLLGDAAHPMVPFLGQGACMAIEDTYSFAMACKAKIANLRDAQEAYDFVRNKRTKKIQRLSMMQGKIYHLKNPLLVSARNAVMKYTNIPGNDLKKIHDYDAHDEMQIYLAFGDLRARGNFLN